MWKMKLIVGLLIWIVGIVLLAIPFGVLSLVKVIVTLIHTGRRRRRSDSGPEEEWFPLQPNDSLLPSDSSWIKPIINVGAVLKIKDGKFSLDELRSHFSQCFLQDDIQGGKYDKLSSYLERKGGYVFRVHVNRINLEEHILEVSLKEGEQLEEFLAGWLLRSYKERKPCWEMLMITSDDGGDQLPRDIAIAFKIHHALVDGYSLLHIIDKLTGNSSPYLVQDFKEGPLTHLRQLIESPAHLGRLSAMPPEKNPFRVVLSPDGRHEWMLAFTSFPLEELKNFRRKHRVKLASVLLTVLIGALRQFVIKDMGQAETEEIVIATTLPWPGHPSRNNSSTPNRDKICNHWATMLGRAPFSERNQLVLLKRIDQELQSYEEVGLNKFMKLIMLPLMWTLPCSTMEIMFSVEAGFGAGITSIVGGDNYKLLGCPVDSIHPFVALHDNSPYLSFQCFTFSHSNKMEVTFGAHPSVFKDRERLDRFTQDYCHKELETLLKCDEN